MQKNIEKTLDEKKKPSVVELLERENKALVAEIENLKKQLEDQKEEKKFLSQALESKGHDVDALQKELDKTNEENTDSKKKAREVENSLKVKDDQIKKLSEAVSVLQGIDQRRVKELNEVIYSYEALQKSMQGTLEVSSLLKDKLLKEISRE